MIITKEHTGARCGKTAYVIRNSIVDTGARDPDRIASFKTLDEATIVLRYMNGGRLSEADEYRAKELIKKADAPTD